MNRGTEKANVARGADLEVSEAVIALHAFLDVDALVGEFLGFAAPWWPADAGFAVARGPEAFRLVASTYARDDARLSVFAPAAFEDVEALFETGDVATVSPELGPFVPPGDVGVSPAPVGATAIALRASDGALHGVVLLTGDGSEDGRVQTLALAERSKVAFDHATVVAGLRELIIQDDTADCFNRRHFEESLPAELSRAGRFRSPLSLIFLDLDNLKSVNSRHGHAMGSRTLFEVAERVRVKIRKFDKLFRFGGDEFCILLPETEWHGALEVAERVRESIAGEPFLRGYAKDPAGVPITASFGIASYPLHARTQREMIEQADRAMQRIKNSTKNSIAVAEIVGETSDE